MNQSTDDQTRGDGMGEAPDERPDVFDVDRIRSLLELMKEYDLRELDLRQAKHRIRLSRGAAPVADALVMRPSASADALPSPAAPAAAPTARPAEPEERDDHMVYITSPMVGTFYSRANPKAEPYVRVGDHVDTDTTVCIIEAMKVFNEIPAEVNGRIVAVLVEDEEPVDYGRPLFKVDTKG